MCIHICIHMYIFANRDTSLYIYIYSVCVRERESLIRKRALHTHKRDPHVLHIL